MSTAILTFIFLFTTANAEFKADLAKIQAKNKKQSEECFKQKDILEKTFKESKNQYVSTLNEKQANTLLDEFNFDLRNSGIFSSERLSLLKKECNENTISLFKNSDDFDCGIEVSDVVFFNTTIERSNSPFSF